jgi:hypothetical protein
VLIAVAALASVSVTHVVVIVGTHVLLY